MSDQNRTTFGCVEGLVAGCSFPVLSVWKPLDRQHDDGRE